MDGSSQMRGQNKQQQQQPKKHSSDNAEAARSITPFSDLVSNIGNKGNHNGAVYLFRTSFKTQAILTARLKKVLLAVRAEAVNSDSHLFVPT